MNRRFRSGEDEEPNVVRSHSMTRPLVCYDGDCRFCRACASALARLDRSGEFSIAPFGDDRVERALSALDPQTRRDSLHLVSDGGVSSAGEALLGIATQLFATRRIASRARRSVFARHLAGIAYRCVSARRNTLSHFVPDVHRTVR